MPLCVGERPVGVLVVERDGSAPLDGTQMRTIATVGTQLALSVETLCRLESMRETFYDSIEAVAGSVETRDGRSEQHCRRLATLSVTVAEAMGLGPEEVESIRLGALLHDIGKVGIADAVLLKDSRLSQEERQQMEKHPEIGHQILMGVMGLSATTLACVRHHHERWDGTGYPDGLAGEAIPLGARIVGIADVWDALSGDRRYKRAYPQHRVHRIIRKDSGVRFDPLLVDLFFKILDEDEDPILPPLARGEPPL
jgi:putative nucleotidyltransferase with HDIG domain